MLRSCRPMRARSPATRAMRSTASRKSCQVNSRRESRARRSSPRSTARPAPSRWMPTSRACGRARRSRSTGRIWRRSSVNSADDAAEAAVHHEYFAGDARGEIRKQECRGVAHLVDGHVAPHGRVFLDELQYPAESRDAGRGQRLDRPGRYRVDADALRSEVRGQVAHGSLQARLGESHGVVVRDDTLGAEVGEGQQRAVAPFHERQRRLGERRKAVRRDVVRLAECLAREPVEQLAGDRFALGKPDGVHEAVQPAPERAQRLEQRRDLGITRDVAGIHGAAIEVLRQVRDALPEAISNIGESQFGALAARRPGDAVGDRAVAEQARDENLLCGEESHRGIILSAMLRPLFPLLFLIAVLAGCGEIWNDPYPVAERGKNILYSVFSERPKHLDPAQSYASDESVFTRQVYEPPLQYPYLKRPYELIPLTAAEIPKPRFEERGGVTYSIYDIRIKPGIRYQPHPGFVAENLSLKKKKIEDLTSPYSLPLGTRELKADDYIYQIKRLAHPEVHSPIFGLMAEYIVGLKEYAARLKKALKPGEWLDLRQHELDGVTRVDDYTYRVTLKGRYPQFVYWLAMPFFCSMPWEADYFFSQKGMAERNFTLDWWPVGTGPFMLSENDPNSRMVLARNPNFRGEPYPSEGEPGDAERGLLAGAGKPMPFVDKSIYTREKEAIPLWNKFLQGYYDLSGIGSETFDQAVRISLEGEAGLSPEMEARGIRLDTTIAPTIFYLGAK